MRHPQSLLAAAAAVLLAATGCSGSSLDTGRPAAGDGTLTVGLIWPASGPYAALGKDQAAGWQLYLDTHGGKLGGRTIKTVTADEGTNQASALTAAKKLLDSDRAAVLVGTANADAASAVAAPATAKKVPFIGTGGRPSTLTDVSYTWHTSWLSREMGEAVAGYMKTAVDGPVYVIGPDYQGGYDQLGGFTDAFTKAGGRLANPDGKTTWTPWPATTNFLPFLNQVKESGAKAVYTFYAGTAAVDFVKQYQQADLKIPLYGAGFLTEGAVLGAQQAAADGVYTVMNYAPNLDNPANRAFAPAYQDKFGAAPNIYAVTGWDAALLLDKAIAAAGNDLTGEAVNKAIAALGAVDSPRGEWRFGTQHAPNQAYYLRQVRDDGRTRANVVTQTLTTLTN
ncbi:ABC transporter substrate-binding protein [Actinoplanes sp. NEAU-A12]|uniref:ABC transporter substrate-binding protein n=1 Tax=Actinoplanes sandaracinus TaxID=3045177 RepID=A0ABT6WM50_9ACTN|nr:ABC transporter substrate-binding protein [Actinoplanes sandaracinus]MDI6100813.1 ABC transporter substrate-binding protein [Actinoplanes sandaracinus]